MQPRTYQVNSPFDTAKDLTALATTLRKVNKFNEAVTSNSQLASHMRVFHIEGPPLNSTSLSKT
jgi:hypothetical protein